MNNTDYEMMAAIEAEILSAVCHPGGHIHATGTLTSLAQSALQHKSNAVHMITNEAHNAATVLPGICENSIGWIYAYE
jgi:hypothetical protein